MSKQLTEAEYRAVLENAFTPEERAVIDSMRRDLTRRGITKEPMRTRMACEFAEVILGSRGK
jgi:hypothetical protein